MSKGMKTKDRACRCLYEWPRNLAPWWTDHRTWSFDASLVY
jgi:hypothetical protein